MTALKVVVFLQLDSVEIIRAWSFAKSSLLTKRSLLQLGDSFDRYILWNVKSWSARARVGAKETAGLNDTLGFSSMYFYPVLVLPLGSWWPESASIRRKETRGAVTLPSVPLPAGHGHGSGGEAELCPAASHPPAPSTLVLLPQARFSHPCHRVTSVLSVMAGTKVVLACWARRHAARESRKLLSWKLRVGMEKPGKGKEPAVNKRWILR